MKYRCDISSVAEAEVDNAFLRLSQIASPTKATQWYAGLLKAIESLVKMPKRCPLARENKYFSQNMKQTQKFTAIIELENYSYVSLCTELDIASQGSTIEEAKQNLVEAIELFLEFKDTTWQISYFSVNL